MDKKRAQNERANNHPIQSNSDRLFYPAIVSNHRVYASIRNRPARPDAHRHNPEFDHHRLRRRLVRLEWKQKMKPPSYYQAAQMLPTRKRSPAISLPCWQRISSQSSQPNSPRISLIIDLIEYPAEWETHCGRSVSSHLCFRMGNHENNHPLPIYMQYQKCPDPRRWMGDPMG